MWLWAGISAVILIGIDYVTKILALTKLKPVGSVTMWEGIMDFTFVENRGAAFGMFSGARWFFVILTLVVVAVLCYYFWKLPKTKEYHWLRIAFVLLFSGALGNFYDRLVRGYVVDFFEFTFIDYPVFNVADVYVVLGTILFVFLILFVIKEEPKAVGEKTKDKE